MKLCMVSILLLFTVVVIIESIIINEHYGNDYTGCDNSECDNGLLCSPVTNECDCEPVTCRIYCKFWDKDEKMCDICGCTRRCNKRGRCPRGYLCEETSRLCVNETFFKKCEDRDCQKGQRCNKKTNKCETPPGSIKCKADRECPETYTCNPRTKRCDCRKVVCRMGCPFWAKNERGCDICQCAKPCQNEQCEKGTLCSNVTNQCDCEDFGCKHVKCPYGFETDENNCEVCICKQPPSCPNCTSTEKKNWFLKKWNSLKNWLRRKTNRAE